MLHHQFCLIPNVFWWQADDQTWVGLLRETLLRRVKNVRHWRKEVHKARRWVDAIKMTDIFWLNPRDCNRPERTKVPWKSDSRGRHEELVPALYSSRALVVIRNKASSSRWPFTGGGWSSSHLLRVGQIIAGVSQQNINVMFAEYHHNKCSGRCWFSEQMKDISST